MAYNFLGGKPTQDKAPHPAFEIPDLEELTQAMNMEQPSSPADPASATPPAQDTPGQVAAAESAAPASAEPADARKKNAAPKKSADQPKSAVKTAKQQAISTRDNERVNIYISATTKQRLEMARIVTKKPTYHLILEITDAMLDRQYRCANPECNATFVMNDNGADAPKYCPICGREKLKHIYIDRM